MSWEEIMAQAADRVIREQFEKDKVAEQIQMFARLGFGPSEIEVVWGAKGVRVELKCHEST